MPGIAHEGPIELLRRNPRLAAALLEGTGVPVPTGTSAAMATGELAAGVQSIDQTLRGLRDQAEHLDRLVARFIVADDEAPWAGALPERSFDAARALIGASSVVATVAARRGLR